MPPGMPNNVNADTDGGDILVSWNRPGSVFVDEYHVEQRQYNTQDWTRTVVAADQTSHRHVGPTPGNHLRVPGQDGQRRRRQRMDLRRHRGLVRHRRTAGAVHLHPHRDRPDTGQVDRVAHAGHPALPAPPQRGRRRLDRGQHPEAETLPLRQLDHGTGVPRVPDPGPQGRAVRRLVAGLPGLRVHSGRRDVPQGQPGERQRSPPALGTPRQRYSAHLPGPEAPRTTAATPTPASPPPAAGPPGVSWTPPAPPAPTGWWPSTTPGSRENTRRAPPPP